MSEEMNDDDDDDDDDVVVVVVIVAAAALSRSSAATWTWCQQMLRTGERVSESESVFVALLRASRIKHLWQGDQLLWYGSGEVNAKEK